MASGIQFTPFEVGQIKAHMYHQMGAAQISHIITKSDGTHPNVQAVVNAMEKLGNDPEWRGERQAGSGAPRKTTSAMDKKVFRELIKNRGKEKVTVAYLKKKIPAIRPLSCQLVADRLHEAGLEYLRCRKEMLVPDKHLPARCAFANAVLQRHQSTLNRWAYSDGTVFYIDRTEAEAQNKKRNALGAMVWRRADCTDIIYADCVGPLEIQ